MFLQWRGYSVLKGKKEGVFEDLEAVFGKTQGRSLYVVCKSFITDIYDMSAGHSGCREFIFIQESGYRPPRITVLHCYRRWIQVVSD